MPSELASIACVFAASAKATSSPEPAWLGIDVVVDDRLIEGDSVDVLVFLLQRPHPAAPSRVRLGHAAARVYCQESATVLTLGLLDLFPRLNFLQQEVGKA